MEYLVHYLRVLFTPSCWVRNYPTSRAWSQKLNQLMDQNAPVVIGPHESKIGDYYIWTSNYPYSYGNYRVGSGPVWRTCEPFLPDRKTVFRLREYLEASQYGM